MFNAERCRARAARYARLAAEVEEADARRAFTSLARIWHDLEPIAETLDRARDARARDMIYSMIDTVAAERRRVA